MNHVSVSPTDGNRPTQGQRKTLTRVGRLLPSDLVAQSVERQRCNPKVVGSIPTLVRVFLCPCVGPFPSVGLTLTWFLWDRNLALHITLYSVNSVFFFIDLLILHGLFLLTEQYPLLTLIFFI